MYQYAEKDSIFYCLLYCDSLFPIIFSFSWRCFSSLFGV